MPFPFELPTTSSILLTDFFDSVTHPSLPLTATTRRSVLKDALKKHKRLPPQAKSTNLASIHEAITSYLPFLNAVNIGSGYRDVGPEKIDVEVKKPLEAEWRSTLSAVLPGREPARPKLTGLHYELDFVLSTLAYVKTQLSRVQLRVLYGSNIVSQEQRTTTIQIATKYLLEAHAIHNYLLSLPSISAAQDAPVDILPSTISALAALALAEASIIVVAKDDPYAASVADERNESNTDWMFKSPDIKAPRARLLASICLAAAEHAAQASGLLAQYTGKIDEDLIKYANDLRRTARGKAIRFLAIQSELGAKTGEALSYLRGAKKELGLSVEPEPSKRKGFKGLKQSWQERREDRKIEKGGEWGMDAGRYEETRVIEALESKWDRENNTINVQAVLPFEPLLANLPGGRDYPHQIIPYVLPTLDPDVFARMRAPPEPDEPIFRGEEADSGDEGANGFEEGRKIPVGAFPGTAGEYGRSATSQSYY